MPSLRAGIIRSESEDRDDRFSERVPNVDGEVERRVVATALGTLHPVEDASGRGVRFAVTEEIQPGSSAQECLQVTEFCMCARL